jgi:hypothetical protein
MLHVRLVLVWLLAVLLPLQGYAAAAKLCCHHGTAHQNTSTRAMGAHKAQKVDSGPADTRRASSATTLHAKQSADALNTALASPATLSRASATAAAGKLKASKVSAVEAAAADKHRKSTACGVCGAMCHSAALAPPGHSISAGPSAAEERRLLVTTIAKRPFDVAEKPPRT